MSSSANGHLNSDTAATDEAAAIVVALAPTLTINAVDPTPTAHTSETPEGPDANPLSDTYRHVANRHSSDPRDGCQSPLGPCGHRGSGVQVMFHFELSPVRR